MSNNINKGAFGELVGRIGCGFAMLALAILILSLLW